MVQGIMAVNLKASNLPAIKKKKKKKEREKEKRATGCGPDIGSESANLIGQPSRLIYPDQIAVFSFEVLQGFSVFCCRREGKYLTLRSPDLERKYSP
jgi:hypothetical protein